MSTAGDFEKYAALHSGWSVTKRSHGIWLGKDGHEMSIRATDPKRDDLKGWKPYIFDGEYPFDVEQARETGRYLIEAADILEAILEDRA